MAVYLLKVAGKSGVEATVTVRAITDSAVIHNDAIAIIHQ